MGEFVVYMLFATLLVGLTVLGVAWAARTIPVPRSWVVAAILVWLCSIVFMTVRPGSGLGVRLNLVPVVVDGPGSAFDALLNTLVFVPPGMLLALLGWRFLASAAVALAISLAIEVTQYLTNWGRTADINDLITNAIGAGAGWGLAWLIGLIRSRRIAHLNADDAKARRWSGV